ncbi:MAG: hypothetical protein J6X62_07005 [Bacteroidales bacterium]|nr:hypothetical protein [Bacteroidales bacterium]
MKAKVILAIACLALLSLSACTKHCRCYRYDGAVESFSPDELKERGTVCSALEEEDRGMKYSLCEYSIWY